MKRAIRRHHYERLKAKRLRDNHWYKELSPSNLGIAINTPCACSCWMCGNPRRHLKLRTVQERRANEIRKRTPNEWIKFT